MYENDIEWILIMIKNVKSVDVEVTEMPKNWNTQKMIRLARIAQSRGYEFGVKCRVDKNDLKNWRIVTEYVKISRILYREGEGYFAELKCDYKPDFYDILRLSCNEEYKNSWRRKYFFECLLNGSFKRFVDRTNEIKLKKEIQRRVNIEESFLNSLNDEQKKLFEEYMEVQNERQRENGCGDDW